VSCPCTAEELSASQPPHGCPVPVVFVGYSWLVAAILCSVPLASAQPPPSSEEVAYLVAATTGNILYRVAVENDTAVIGLPYDDKQGKRSGTAYVYVRKNAVWKRQARLLAADGQPEDQFGFAVAVHGDTAVIGAAADDGISGSAHVFIRVKDEWRQQAKLLGDDTSQLFGSWVKVGDQSVVIGASSRSPPERDGNVNVASQKDVAYFFTRTGSVWIQQAKFVGVTTQDFGNSAEQLQSNQARPFERDKNLNIWLDLRGGIPLGLEEADVEGCLKGADSRGVWIRGENGWLIFVPHSETGGYSVSGRCSPD